MLQWNYQIPQIVTNVRAFLGLIRYYKNYVKGYAKLPSPLFELIRKDQRFTQSYACFEAFNKLKKCLVEAPILSKFDFSRPFIRDVDRYVKGVSAILSQKDGRTEMVVVYASKKLFDVQRGFILWRENVMKWYGE